MGTSLYPNQLDNSTSIPVATDNVTPVNAEVINRLRDPIIAVESELGLNPSSTYGTVKARLDAMEAAIANGGGGGGGAISVQDNGSTIVSLASILNFTGTGVSVISPSTGLAEINISGGSATQVQETIAVTVPGQTAFTLSQIPAQASALQMFLNGSKLEEGLEYINTPLTTTVTYTGLISLNVIDTVEFWYLVDAASIISSYNLAIKDSGSVIESAATSIDFTGNVTVTSISSGLVQVNVPNATVAVENNGTPVDSSVTLIDTVGKLISTSVSPGNVQFEVPESKIRVYIDSSNFSGASSGVDQTITWNGTSAKITPANASLSGGTQLTTTKSGTYLVQGQLTIQPIVDSISSIIIKVIHNGLTDVHTIYDAGAVWGTGINRSFSFNFPMELAASDTLEVSWQHTGSMSSATDVVFGDDLSWFSITLV
jgi:hypothetical protein